MPFFRTSAIAALLVGVSSFSGCITPSEKKAMQGDIFNTQTRLLTLEQQLTESKTEVKTTGDSASKRIASTKADMDRLMAEIQRMHGDIDGLRVGVVTGQMPGTDPDKEGSVASTLNSLTQRLEAIETAQEEILEAIKKVGSSSGKRTADLKKADAKKKAGGADDLQAAFDDKHFKQVTDDAPKLLKEAKGGEKEQIRYLLAESFFKLGKMRDAALKYNELVESKPSAKYMPAAKMRIGDCFKNLGDDTTARLYYEELIKEFPKSDEAAKARESLAKLGKGGKDKG